MARTSPRAETAAETGRPLPLAAGGANSGLVDPPAPPAGLPQAHGARMMQGAPHGVYDRDTLAAILARLAPDQAVWLVGKLESRSVARRQRLDARDDALRDAVEVSGLPVTSAAKRVVRTWLAIRRGADDPTKFGAAVKLAMAMHGELSPLTVGQILRIIRGGRTPEMQP